MFHKLKLFFGFCCLSLPLVLSSCAPSFSVKKDAGYDKFTDIKACKIENNWVTAHSGAEVAFDLTKSMLKNGNSDYFLKITSQNLLDFAIGKYLILTVDGKSEKFKLSRTIAFGKYTQLSFTSGQYFMTAAVNLSKNQVASLVHAHAIQFSMQGEPGLVSPTEINGVFSAQNIVNLRQFERNCMLNNGNGKL